MLCLARKLTYQARSSPRGPQCPRQQRARICNAVGFVRVSFWGCTHCVYQITPKGIPLDGLSPKVPSSIQQYTQQRSQATKSSKSSTLPGRGHPIAAPCADPRRADLQPGPGRKAQCEPQQPRGRCTMARRLTRWVGKTPNFWGQR